jgi:hypothetical protein
VSYLSILKKKNITKIFEGNAKRFSCSLFSVTCGHDLKGKIEKINVALKEDSKIRNFLTYWARLAELKNHDEKLKKELNKTSLDRLNFEDILFYNDKIL